LKIIGGIYLLYLGFTMWRRSMKEKTYLKQDQQTARRQFKSSYLTGLATNLTNPKTLIFYASIFTIVITDEGGSRICLPILCALTSFSWFSFVTVVFSAPRLRTGYQKWAKIIDRSAGTIMLLFGVMLALSGTS